MPPKGIYILSVMRLCFSDYFIVISELITKFALFANQSAMVKYLNRLKKLFLHNNIRQIYGFLRCFLSLPFVLKGRTDIDRSE